ncbi:cytochrome P450 [Melanogaster broomeanus]|nr:cytochrome P450 [Melanogaster broomeanus]
MSHWLAVCAIGFGCTVVLHIRLRYLKKQRHATPYPLPPGPPGLPFIGNVVGINIDAPWLTYAEWAKTYGDIIHSRLLGKDIIIINSEKVAKDLLEDRSRNYSDRPHLLASELFGIDFNTVFLPYGDRWRLHRRFFHQTFRADSLPRFAPMLQRRSSQLLRRLLDKPDLLSEHVFEYSAAIIMNSIYDYDPVSRNDELVDTANKVLSMTLDAFRPDVAVAIGTFPGLVNLPSWMPLSFKPKVALARGLIKRTVEVPSEYSVQNIKNGSSAPSMVYDALRQAEEKGTSTDSSWIQNLKEAAATGFLAASETTSSVMLTFFLMMILAPEAQEKAQAQIDVVVGRNRLPTIEDRASLPYVDAILRETLRFNPPVPLSVPHAAINDDVYGEFHIPKGGIIVANLWSMTHNESKYPNPQEFIPERFLNDDGTLKPADVENIVFGFGRRICVGRHFGDASVWTAMAKVLSVFKLSKPRDENGEEVQVEMKFSSGLGVHPLPFPCSIVSRIAGMDSEKLEQLIDASTS